MSGKSSPIVEFLVFVPVWFIWLFTKYSPKPVSRLFWFLLASFFWNLVKKRREIVLGNLKLAFPDMPDDKAAETGFRSVNNILRGVEEFCRQERLAKVNIDDVVTAEGMENLERAYKKGKGVILPTLHAYNMETITAMVSLKGYPVHWVVRELDNRFVYNIQVKMRKSVGLKIIAKEKAMRLMIEALRKGDVLSFTIDQKASLNGEWVKFLGVWSSTTKGPAVLHLRTGAPIVPIFPVPLEDGSHLAVILPEIKYTPSGNKQRDVFAITQILADLQSEYLRKHPEVWIWMHRKWSMTPGDELLGELQKREEEFLYAGPKADVSAIR
jgi:KDO2-lipid IV(A) lauroyltransferase